MGPDLLLFGDIRDVVNLPTPVIGWDVDVAQRDKGSLETNTILFRLNSFLFSETRTNKGLMYRGCCSADIHSFVIPMNDAGPYLTCGQSVSYGEMFSYPVGRELDQVAQADTHDINLCFPTAMLEEIAEESGEQALYKEISDGGVLRQGQASLGKLRSLLQQAAFQIRTRCETIHFGRLYEDILSAFTDCLFASNFQARKVSTELRRRTVQRVIEFIESDMQEDISLYDLCSAAQVSERTMLYAFKQELGISPKGFLKNHRLHRVYRELLNRESGKVTDVATRWGFWHMGQFGVDYKRLFGELPSETLRRMPSRVQFLVPPSFRAA